MQPIETAIPAIAFIGRSGSGKTVLVEKIITELVTRGRRVGSVKHHGHRGFDVDVPGKDSWRHAQAGSIQTVVSSPDKIAYIRKLDHELELPEIIECMTGIEVVIVEGYRQAGAPAIEVLRAGSEKDMERSRRSDVLDTPGVIGVATDIPLAAEKATEKNLPVFDINDASSICDFIEETILR